jgi:hypothetical protein
MQQHDGGDRVEYLQEVEHSDSLFYVPPSNDAKSSVFGLKTNLAGFVKEPKMHYYESQKKARTPTG